MDLESGDAMALFADMVLKNEIESPANKNWTPFSGPRLIFGDSVDEATLEGAPNTESSQDVNLQIVAIEVPNVSEEMVEEEPAKKPNFEDKRKRDPRKRRTSLTVLVGDDVIHEPSIAPQWVPVPSPHGTIGPMAAAPIQIPPMPTPTHKDATPSRTPTNRELLASRTPTNRDLPRQASGLPLGVMPLAPPIPGHPPPIPQDPSGGYALPKPPSSPLLMQQSPMNRPPIIVMMVPRPNGPPVPMIHSQVMGAPSPILTPTGFANSIQLYPQHGPHMGVTVVSPEQMVHLPPRPPGSSLPTPTHAGLFSPSLQTPTNSTNPYNTPLATPTSASGQVSPKGKSGKPRPVCLDWLQGKCNTKRWSCKFAHPQLPASPSGAGPLPISPNNLTISVGAPPKVVVPEPPQPPQPNPVDSPPGSIGHPSSPHSVPMSPHDSCFSPAGHLMPGNLGAPCAAPRPIVCPVWELTGTCKFGDYCRDAHPTLDVRVPRACLDPRDNPFSQKAAHAREIQKVQEKDIVVQSHQPLTPANHVQVTVGRAPPGLLVPGAEVFDH